MWAILFRKKPALDITELLSTGLLNPKEISIFETNFQKLPTSSSTTNACLGNVPLLTGLSTSESWKTGTKLFSNKIIYKRNFRFNLTNCRPIIIPPFPCVSVCLSVTKISVAFFMATFHYRCLQLYHTICVNMPFRWIDFCTNRTSTSC